jgi:anti-anti-sigma factor
MLELRLSGEVDMATVVPLRDATKAAVASRDYDTLVFDLSGVTFMDSTGLHVLTQAQRSMAAAGGGTKVICAAGALLKVFELTALDRVLTIVSHRDEAFAVAA